MCESVTHKTLGLALLWQTQSLLCLTGGVILHTGGVILLCRGVVKLTGGVVMLWKGGVGFSGKSHQHNTENTNRKPVWKDGSKYEEIQGGVDLSVPDTRGRAAS